MDRAQTALGLLVIATPVLCVWRLRRAGIVVGGAAAWLIGLLGDLVVPSPDPEAGPLRALWLRYGSLATLGYASLLWLGMWAWRKSRAPAAVPPARS